MKRADYLPPLIAALLAILFGLATGCATRPPKKPTTPQQLASYEARYRDWLRHHPEVTPVELP